MAKISTDPNARLYSIQQLKNFILGFLNSSLFKEGEKQQIEKLMNNPNIDIRELWESLAKDHRARINGYDNLLHLQEEQQKQNNDHEIEENIIYAHFGHS